MKLLLLALTTLSLITTYSQEEKNSTEDRFLYEQPFNCQHQITNARFKYELMNVKQQPSYSAKKMVAKRIASTYCLTADQVFRLCMVLPPNADRLYIAKRCYPKCVDQENYEVVFEAMSGKALYQQLSEYIAYYNYNYIDDNGHDYHPGAFKRPMTSANFAAAKQTIQDANFDNTRLETAKTIAGTNWLSTDQIIELCRLFSFEQSKLDFAKYAFDRTTDKNNYFRVSTVFDFDASKSELNQFIQQANKS